MPAGLRWMAIVAAIGLFIAALPANLRGQTPGSTTLGSTWYHDGSSIKAGPAGTRVTAFATGVRPNTAFKLVTGRDGGEPSRPCSRDVVPVLDSVRFSNGRGFIPYTGGTVNRSPGAWQVCFSEATPGLEGRSLSAPRGFAVKVPHPISGLSWSAVIGEQDPRTGIVFPAAQVQDRVLLAAPYTQWVRTFGCRNGLEIVGRLGHEAGLLVAMQAWLGPQNTAAELQANQAEIGCLIDRVNAGEADLAIVGSEAVFRNELSEATVTEYIAQVRNATGQRVPVGTAETSNVLIARPGLVIDSDVALVNIYPFWSGVPLAKALAELHHQFKQIQTIAAGRPVYMAETGWPSAGSPGGGAVPSVDNACNYFLQAQSWARAEGVATFYFSAFDEAWKANTPEGDVGAHWGIATSSAVLKPCMAAPFDGISVADTWSGRSVVGGPGTPSLTFAALPAPGTAGRSFGTVNHVAPRDVQIAPYIKVNGVWWTKPTFALPKMPVYPDGTWYFDGLAADATEVAVFVIPTGYSPPPASGSATIPAEIQSVALAQRVVPR